MWQKSKLFVLSLILLVASQLFGCATTGQPALNDQGQITAEEMTFRLVEQNQKTTVQVWQNGKLFDEFSANKEAIMLIGDTADGNKKITFIRCRTYEVPAECLTDLINRGFSQLDLNN